MTETSVIDLRDKANPPPDDPDKAPFGFRWDAKKEEWVAKRSAGGRKPGLSWFGKDDAVEDRVEEVLEERGFSDPAPAWHTTRTKTPKRSPPKVNARIKNDMSAAVGMIIMVAGPGIMSKDPYCGGAFLDNAQQITDAVIPLMCRSHTVVAFFSDTSDNGWFLWFKLAIALAPVGAAIGRHHILNTVEIQTDPETGDLYAVPRDMADYSTDLEPEDANAAG
jgi:hypothetical protein